MAGAGVKAVLSAGDAGSRRAEPRGAAGGWSVGRSVCRSVCRSVGRSGVGGSVGSHRARLHRLRLRRKPRMGLKYRRGVRGQPWPELGGGKVTGCPGHQRSRGWIPNRGVSGSSMANPVDPKLWGAGFIEGQCNGSQIRRR